MNKRTHFLTVSGALAVAVLSGCGDDGDRPTTGFTESATAVPNALTGSSSGTGEDAPEPESGSGSASESGSTGAGVEDTTADPTTTTVDPSCPDGCDMSSSSGESEGTAGDGTTGEGTSGGEQACAVDVPDPACSADFGGLVFVATVPNGGSVNHDGLSPDTPVSTLSKAIELAQQCPETCDIVVSEGVYDGSIVLASGVSIFGGYAPGSFAYAPAQNKVEVRGTDERAVIADSIERETRLVGLTIRGADFENDGKSSYALWVQGGDSWELSVERSELFGGHGGDGVPGKMGAHGANGSSGGSAKNRYGASGGASTCGSSGGGGGDGTACQNGWNSSGSNGKTSGGKAGIGGKGGTGHCAWGDLGDSGGAGAPGTHGGPGTAGKAAAKPTDADGDFVDGLWKGATGNAGDAGTAGGGGGGGGAGGSDKDYEVGVGGGGGGGAGGGCGGKPGEPGRAGGASFGVVLVDATVQFLDTHIEAGNGGQGGDGGAGSNGGAGGVGGKGSKGTTNSGEGGTGGAGGDGGDGGGAGGSSGGCGGASIGLALVGMAEADLIGSAALAGQGGKGGAGGAGGLVGGKNQPAGMGASGCTGMAASERVF